MTIVGLIVAAALALVFVVASRAHEKALMRAEGSKPNVLRFEFAGTGRASHELLSEAGTTGRSALRSAIGIDTWIILGYAPGLAVLSLTSTSVVSWAADGTVETIGILIAVAAAVAALLAGALDLRENAALIEILDRWSDAPVGPDDRGEDAAAIEQQHRRDLITTFDRPSAQARRLAALKFLLIVIVLFGWGLTILCITVTRWTS